VGRILAHAQCHDQLPFRDGPQDVAYISRRGGGPGRSCLSGLLSLLRGRSGDLCATGIVEMEEITIASAVMLHRGPGWLRREPMWRVGYGAGRGPGRYEVSSAQALF